MPMFFTSAPKIKPKWFYATDRPKYMPTHYHYERTADPQKFESFSEYDIERIETAYQNLLADPDQNEDDYTIPVNEDHLFDVNLKAREVKPVYWEGAVYEVRRGIWFYHADSAPVPHELTLELEEAYLLLKPYEEKITKNNIKTGAYRTSEYYSLKGKYKEGKYVIFLDHETAYVIDDINGFTAPMRLAFMIRTNVGNAMDVIRLKRGSDIVLPPLLPPSPLEESKEDKELKTTEGELLPEINSETESKPGSEIDPDLLDTKLVAEKETGKETVKETEKSINNSSQVNTEEREQLFTKLSKVFRLDFQEVLFDTKEDTTRSHARETTEASINEEVQSQLEEDFMVSKYQDGNRKIDHLIICVHGIGQQLSVKYQSFNFVHGINVFRKNIKNVYDTKPGLQSLRPEEEKNNCGIQVIPICWRHKIDFQPDRPVREDMPSLQDITIEAMKPLRNILGSVFFDLLIYYEPRYFHQILDLVVSEINHVYTLFKQRNPDFDGKVSLVGHSLGSSIGFEILSFQSSDPSSELFLNNRPKQLSFPVENYFAIGSPVGLFQLLKTQKIGSPKYGDKTTKDVSVPQCQNLYNIFHPCDPVAHRMEPLVSRELTDVPPEYISTLIAPSAISIPSPLSTLSKFSDKLVESAAKTWSSVTIKTQASVTKLVSQVVSEVKQDEAEKEKILADVVADSLAQDSPLDPTSGATNMTDDPHSRLLSLNKNGRLDYSLQQGLFDISILSSVSAHINYFEDENVASFIVKETLKC